MSPDPIATSLIVMIVTLVIVAIILFSVRPSMVLKLNSAGVLVVDWAKVLAYSAIVAVLFAIVILIVLSYGHPYKVGESPMKSLSPRFNATEALARGRRRGYYRR